MKRILSQRIWLLALAVTVLSGPAWAVETLETKGAVEAVTVYRGQALVTRLLDVPGAAGLREVVVTDLPEQIVPGSIYAEADGAEVRSVRYRVRPVSQDVREEVRKIDEQVRQLQDQLQAVQRRKGLLDEHKAYLDKLEQFVAPTANLELTKGVLNAETLKTLTSYQMEQRKTLAEEGLKLGLEERGLHEKIELLSRERQVISGSSSRTAREAIVFLNLQRAGGKVRLRYLVNNANWMPSYNVRTDADRKQITVEYYASIQQMSGEDWPDVSMTLSTATPSLIAKGPALLPLTVALTPPPAQQQATNGQAVARDLRSADYAATRDELWNKLKQVENDRAQLRVLAIQSGQAQQPAQTLDANAPGGTFMVQAESEQAANLDLALNSLGCDLQMLDLVNRGKVVRKGEASPPPADLQGLCVTYQLAARTTLPSRSDQQLVQIAALPMKAEFYKVATPLLTGYVYDEARVTNGSSLVLLAGPVATYVAGQFVGHGEIPTVSSGEGFTVGLGIDASLRTVRELADRVESVQGGNRVAEFTYRLTVENFAAAPAKVRLLDRLPHGKEPEVKITMVSSSVEVSGDAAYQTDRKKGLLRWEIEVPPQAIGMQAKALEYKFRVEHDKGMTVSGLPVAAK